MRIHTLGYRTESLFPPRLAQGVQPRGRSLAFRLLRFGLLLLSSAIATVVLCPLALVLRVVHAFGPRREDRVFIGFHEIANVIQSISECLAETYSSVRAVIITNPFYGMENVPRKQNLLLKYFQGDRGIRTLLFECILPFRLITEIVKNDLFVIIWNRSFMPLSIDYLLLKLAGKQLVLIHCGDDVRYRPMQRIIDAEVGHRSWPSAEASLYQFFMSLYYQTLSESLASVISHPDQSTFQSGALFHFRFPQKALLAESKRASVRPLILHCPSDRSVKGTDVVLSAIHDLREQGLKFDFELIENSSNEYVLERMKNADIVVDQPSVWIGRVAVEAMAAGCCVVGGNRSMYMQRFDSPVVQFEPNAGQLAAALKELIVNAEVRQSKMNECFSFWKAHYSYEEYAKYFQAVTRGTAPAFLPRPDQKRFLLRGASSWLERWVVRLGYYPKTAFTRE